MRDAMAPHSLVFDLQCQLLARLCEAAGRHFQGLAAAARACRKAGLIDQVTAKKICDVDTAYHIVRHVTHESVDEFMDTVAFKLRGSSGKHEEHIDSSIAGDSNVTVQLASPPLLFDIYDCGQDAATQTIDSIPPFDHSVLWRLEPLNPGPPGDCGRFPGIVDLDTVPFDIPNCDVEYPLSEGSSLNEDLRSRCDDSLLQARPPDLLPALPACTQSGTPSSSSPSTPPMAPAPTMAFPIQLVPELPTTIEEQQWVDRCWKDLLLWRMESLSFLVRDLAYSA